MLDANVCTRLATKAIDVCARTSSKPRDKSIPVECCTAEGAAGIWWARSGLKDGPAQCSPGRRR
ncbi:transcriptional regulator, LysR family [Anopheles sinensis]|uniref:Transcriptional regulator, LysR family n=1 Tax=Anopheles sinensis TaxID=74873 RepID=A0A084VJ66_ANOSI|nr:transcriptional regulator, LysR family [Anopheles sinensis]